METRKRKRQLPYNKRVLELYKKAKCMDCSVVIQRMDFTRLLNNKGKKLTEREIGKLLEDNSSDTDTYILPHDVISPSSKSRLKKNENGMVFVPRSFYNEHPVKSIMGTPRSARSKTQKSAVPVKHTPVVKSTSNTSPRATTNKSYSGKRLQTSINVLKSNSVNKQKVSQNASLPRSHKKKVVGQKITFKSRPENIEYQLILSENKEKKIDTLIPEVSLLTLYDLMGLSKLPSDRWTVERIPPIEYSSISDLTFDSVAENLDILMRDTLPETFNQETNKELKSADINKINSKDKIITNKELSVRIEKNFFLDQMSCNKENNSPESKNDSLSKEDDLLQLLQEGLLDDMTPSSENVDSVKAVKPDDGIQEAKQENVNDSLEEILTSSEIKTSADDDKTTEGKTNVDEEVQQNTNVNEENTIVNEKNMTTDEENITIDKENTPVDEEKITVDEETISMDVENITVDKETIPMDVENITVDKETIPMDVENITVDKETIPTNVENITVDKESINMEEESISLDKENTSMNKENITSIVNKEIISNEGNIIVDKENTTLDEECINANEENTITNEVNIDVDRENATVNVDFTTENESNAYDEDKNIVNEEVTKVNEENVTIDKIENIVDEESVIVNEEKTNVNEAISITDKKECAEVEENDILKNENNDLDTLIPDTENVNVDVERIIKDEVTKTEKDNAVDDNLNITESDSSQNIQNKAKDTINELEMPNSEGDERNKLDIHNNNKNNSFKTNTDKQYNINSVVFKRHAEDKKTFDKSVVFQRNLEYYIVMKDKQVELLGAPKCMTSIEDVQILLQIVDENDHDSFNVICKS